MRLSSPTSERWRSGSPPCPFHVRPLGRRVGRRQILTATNPRTAGITSDACHRKCNGRDATPHYGTPNALHSGVSRLLSATAASLVDRFTPRSRLRACSIIASISLRDQSAARAVVSVDGMAIVVTLDDVLHDRRMTLTELGDRVGLTLANLSILKTGKARAIRFSTLEAICGRALVSARRHPAACAGAGRSEATGGGRRDIQVIPAASRTAVITSWSDGKPDASFCATQRPSTQTVNSPRPPSIRRGDAPV
jgi:putative transcriptional regulator